MRYHRGENQRQQGMYRTRTSECLSLLGELQSQLARIDLELDRAWHALDDAELRQAFGIAGDLTGMLEHAAQIASRLSEAARKRIEEGEAGIMPGILADRSATFLRDLRIREGRVLELLDRAMIRKEEAHEA